MEFVKTVSQNLNTNDPKLVANRKSNIADAELEELLSKQKASIKVVGCGGGGNNTINRITEVGIACENAGADALCAVNTVSAMSINIEAKRPVLAFKKGGMSGPALKPIAVRCVYDLFEKVKIPIIGEGGCTNGRDAIEFLQAGAAIVGVGSAVRQRGPKVFEEICGEMVGWMKQNGYSSIKQLVGAAHG